MDVNIISCPSTRIAVLQHRGSLTLSTPPPRVLSPGVRRADYRPSPPAIPGDRLDDPQTTPQEAFRFDICGTVDRPVGENAFGVINGEIPADAAPSCAITARWTRWRTAFGFSIATGYPLQARRYGIFRCTSVTSILSMRWLSMNCKPIFICRWPD